MVQGIDSVGGITTARLSATPPARDVARAEIGGASFGDVIGQALDSLQALQGQADAAAVDFATGGETELHDVMISMEKVNLGFQLTLQVRNKVLEAYQEIMRMQV